MYSVMWSEHCSYKSSKVHLRQFGEKAPKTDALLVGHRRERRGRGHRRRLGGDVQGRESQPPVLRRALPGCGDRHRRHRARHHLDGCPAGRRDGPAAVRTARRRRHPPRAARDRRRHRWLRQLPGPAEHRRRGGVRPVVRREPVGERAVRRGHAPRGHQARARIRRRQPGRSVRRAHRRRRHRRGVGARERDVRRREAEQATGRAGRRPVHGEGAHRVLSRGVRGRPRRRHPGPRWRGTVVRDLGARVQR